MNLMPLAQLIEDEGLGVKGQSLFLNMMPSEAESAILLRSPLVGTKIDYELKNYFKTEFQLIVRTHAYADGEALIKQVCDLLTVTDKQVEDVFFKTCRPRTEPVVFPLSAGNLLEFNVMFDTVYVKTA